MNTNVDSVYDGIIYVTKCSPELGVNEMHRLNIITHVSLVSEKKHYLM